MPGPCFNPYGCEWSIDYFWRLMNWLVRLDIIVLVLLLVYILAVVIRVSYRYQTTRRVPEIDSVNRRKAVVELGIQVSSLNSIACVAPYLGHVGTWFGVMGAFRGIGMEKHTAEVMVISTLTAALVTAAAGMIVAVPATCSYNYFRTRLDSLEDEIPPRKFPLMKRISAPASFARIAAPLIALSMTGFMLSPSDSAVGLDVRLLKVASLEPENQPVVIRLLTANSGSPIITVNSTLTPESELKDVLQGLLKPKQTVNVMADKDVRWADVASAIDVAEAPEADVVLLTAVPPRCSSHNCR
jgi:biopolymer transport protein ExbD